MSMSLLKKSLIVVKDAIYRQNHVWFPGMASDAQGLYAADKRVAIRRDLGGIVTSCLTGH